MRCENKKFVIGWTNGGIQIDRSLWGPFLGPRTRRTIFYLEVGGLRINQKFTKIKPWQKSLVEK